MENASKALIMAAEILVGIMIISIGVYLFNIFADYSRENYKQIEETQIAEFNNTFLKFQSSNTYETATGVKTVPLACTIHDVVGLANFAQKYNLQNDLLVENAGGNFSAIGGNLDSTVYVQIDFINGKRNLETYSTKALAELIKTYDLESTYDAAINKTTTKARYFVCECQINAETRRVNYVSFREFSDRQYVIMEEINGI